MKRFVLLSTIICICGFLLAQVPQAIQYQAVIRDAQGNPLTSQQVNLRISILTDSLMGPAVYTETHQVTTSSMGLVSLAIGNGLPVNGQFHEIPWGDAPHYASIEMDMTLSGNYILMSKTQLLSVPYALYAGSSGMKQMTTQERDAIQHPRPGMEIINLDDGCLNVYNGTWWLVLCSPCTPQPDLANAGPDMLNITGTSAILQGNDPVYGNGSWSVISGSGGQLGNDSQHNSSFTGHPGALYTLVWTISNNCGSSSDTVQIGFACDPQHIPADAGNDVAVCPGGCAQLTATGGVSYLWSTQEQQASIQVCPSQTTTYSVTVTDDYGCTAEASVTVTIDPLPNANAGPDVNICLGECTQLQASGGATYLWSTQETTASIQVCPVQTTIYSVTVTDAQGCVATDEVTVTVNALPVADAGQDTAICPGDCAQLLASGGTIYLWDTQATTAGIQVCPTVFSTYMVTVTDLNGCSAMDSVSVEMLPLPDQANAGPDNLNIPGTSTTLQGNTPVNGSGQWAIISGQGGSFADDTLATTVFTGQTGSIYSLLWTISNLCGSTHDTVLIGFIQAIPVFTYCGDTLTDNRDGQQYPTVQIGSQCWMARNLNIGVMVNSVNTGMMHSDVADNGTIEKYCYDNDQGNCLIYGGLYDWNEAMEYTTAEGGRGICPQGWHIPAKAEWCLLSTSLDPSVNCNATHWTGKHAGSRLKETGLNHWSAPNAGATNSSGFTALGSGYRFNYGDFQTLTVYTSFWSSTRDTAGGSIAGLALSTYDTGVLWPISFDNYGYALRCVWDSTLVCTPPPDQANAGPDSLNITGTSITLQANQPVNGSGQWSVISGNGGTFTNDTLATTVFSGQAGSTYTLEWTISNLCGISKDTVLIGFTTSQAFNCGDTLMDIRDGQQYPTVQIGTQCWMARNLNIGTMSGDQTNNATIEKYCFNSDANYCAIYGGLYQWNEMMNYSTVPGSQGICPSGWHVPTAAEWCTLTTYLDPSVNCNTDGWSGMNAGGKMKQTGTLHWDSPNTGATNSSGFTALGSGFFRSFNGAYWELRHSASFWSSSGGTFEAGNFLYLNCDSANVFLSTQWKGFGLSLRCLRDSIPPCTPQPDQANAGPDSLNISGTSITLQANQPVNGIGVWTVISGLGGSVADSGVYNTLFTGQVGSQYTLVWTISTVCGSNSDTLNVSFIGTSIYPSGYVHCDPANPTAVVDVTNPATGKTWMDRNLGASQVATSSIDVNAYGDLFQWGRFADGHQCRTSASTTTLSTTDQPGHRSFIVSGWTLPCDWRSPQNTNLWQGLNGVNIPCPVGYRLPTEAELNAEILSWSSNNAAGAFGSPLQLPLAGYRSFSDGFLGSVGSYGRYWSSTVSNTFSRHLNFYGTNATMLSNNRALGSSVRCIKETSQCTPQPDQANAGPDSLNISGTSITLQANQPVNGIGVWTVVSGLGGSLADSGVHNTLFTGLAGNLYALVWTIANQCGSTHDTVNISFAQANPVFIQCGDTLTDARDGKQYPTVQISTQCWMAKNLNVGVMVNSIYSGSLHTDVSNNGVIEKYCYDNDVSYCATYGGLYNWSEMMDYTYTPGGQGICPAGWHIPTDPEWCAMTTALDSTVDCTIWGLNGLNTGGMLKLTGFDHWMTPNTGATNSSGFSAMAAGHRTGYGDFVHILYHTSFWTSSEFSSANGIRWRVSYDTAITDRYNSTKTNGFSVRCVLN